MCFLRKFVFLLVVFWNLQKLFTTLRQRSPTTSFLGYKVLEFLTKPTFIHGPTNLARNFSRLETSPLACLARYFSRHSRKRKEETSPHSLPGSVNLVGTRGREKKNLTAVLPKAKAIASQGNSRQFAIERA